MTAVPSTSLDLAPANSMTVAPRTQAAHAGPSRGVPRAGWLIPAWNGRRDPTYFGHTQRCRVSVAEFVSSAVSIPPTAWARIWRLGTGNGALPHAFAGGVFTSMFVACVRCVVL